MRIKVVTRPNSGKLEIIKLGEGEYKAYLKSNPENNRANLELIKLIKKELGFSDVKIVSGKTSRKKLIEVNF